MTQVIFHVVMHQYNPKDFSNAVLSWSPRLSQSKESWKKLFKLRDGGTSLVVPPDHQGNPKWMYPQHRNRLTDLENELTVARRGEWGEAIVRKSGIEMYTLLYFKWITNKDLLYIPGNSAQCYVPAWMGGECEGEWIHAYAFMHMKLSQHCSSAILQYKIKA